MVNARFALYRSLHDLRFSLRPRRRRPARRQRRGARRVRRAWPEGLVACRGARLVADRRPISDVARDRPDRGRRGAGGANTRPGMDARDRHLALLRLALCDGAQRYALAGRDNAARRRADDRRLGLVRRALVEIASLVLSIRYAGGGISGGSEHMIDRIRAWAACLFLLVASFTIAGSPAAAQVA